MWTTPSTTSVDADPPVDVGSVDAESGEYHCSDGGCRRVWVHDGGPLRHQPVDDVYSTLTPRRWHPCPSCLDTDPLLADFAHDVRRRTAEDILAWA